MTGIDPNRPFMIAGANVRYLKAIGWGWFYLSTILDDFSRYIIARKLCTTMRAAGVTDTLELALKASGLEQATVAVRPQLLALSEQNSKILGAAIEPFRSTRKNAGKSMAPKSGSDVLAK